MGNVHHSSQVHADPLNLPNLVRSYLLMMCPLQWRQPWAKEIVGTTLKPQPRQWTRRGPVCLSWEIQTFTSLHACTVNRDMSLVSDTRNDRATHQVDCTKISMVGTMHGQHQAIWLLLQLACKNTVPRWTILMVGEDHTSYPLLNLSWLCLEAEITYSPQQQKQQKAGNPETSAAVATMSRTRTGFGRELSRSSQSGGDGWQEWRVDTLVSGLQVNGATAQCKAEIYVSTVLCKGGG